jgi:uncharacterized membrane protein
MRRDDQHIADDEAQFAPLRQARAGRSGKQVGDPAKAAAAIYPIVGESNPPSHFFLGTDALSFVTTKMDTLQAEIGRWTHVTISTDATRSGHCVSRGERRPTRNACKH